MPEQIQGISRSGNYIMEAATFDQLDSSVPSGAVQNTSYGLMKIATYNFVSGTGWVPVGSSASAGNPTAFIASGNIYIQSGGLIGTLGTGTNFIGFVSGNTTTSVSSVFITSGNIYIQSGGVIGTLGTGTNYIGQVSGNQIILGSVAITSYTIGSQILIDRSGITVYFDNNTMPAWRGIGSVLTTGSVNIGGVASVAGSVAVTNTPSTNTFIVSGGVIGTLGTGTNYIGQISGNEVVLGSVAITTSIITTSGNIASLGSPSFKQTVVAASGTYNQVWTLANTGSRLEIHGWQISKQAAGRIQVVGSPSTVIVDYIIPGSSVIEKTFVFPIIPMGAGVNIGVQNNTAGSTNITIYGREVT